MNYDPATFLQQPQGAASLLDPQQQPSSFRWATVTALDPLRIRLDQSPHPLDATPSTLVANLAVGDRVWCQIVGRRVVILGQSSKDAPDTGWITPSFQNGWENYGATYESVGYRKQAGQVHIKGLIRNGTVGSTVFTLPAGFRPAGTIIEQGLTNLPTSNTVIRLNVRADGTVAPSGDTSGAWISLAGISFFADGQ